MTDDTTLPCTARLRNGLEVTIRPLQPDDREAMARAVRLLDRESIYTRLFSYRKELTPAALDRIMKVDPEREVALVVTTGTPPAHTIIAGCRYIELDADDGRRVAEVAFMVEEDYQGQGIAGRLLRHLIAIARARGMKAVEADVLRQNASMLRVFERCGLPMRTRAEAGSVHLSLALTG